MIKDLIADLTNGLSKIPMKDKETNQEHYQHHYERNYLSIVMNNLGQHPILPNQSPFMLTSPLRNIQVVRYSLRRDTITFLFVLFMCQGGRTASGVCSPLIRETVCKNLYGKPLSRGSTTQQTSEDLTGFFHTYLILNPSFCKNEKDFHSIF